MINMEDIDENENTQQIVDALRSAHAAENKEATRIKLASYFEFTISYIILGIIIYLAYEETQNNNTGHALLAQIIKNQSVIAAFALFFLETFSWILTRYTIVVGMVTFLVRYPAVLAEAIGAVLPFIPYRKSREITPTSALRDLIRGSQHVKETTANSTAISNMKEAIGRSIEATKSAKFRPNALMFAGSTISVLGILLFIATLPSAFSDTEDWVRRAIEVTPRLFLFLFVQVLAGFFLRQYRTSLEDYRYYEAVLRSREDQFSSLLLRKEADNSTSVNEFADKLLDHKDFLKISQGETSFVLETSKIEKNEFASLADLIINMLKKQEEKDVKKDAS